jgi:hypothetical protein
MIMRKSRIKMLGSQTLTHKNKHVMEWVACQSKVAGQGTDEHKNFMQLCGALIWVSGTVS